MSSPARTRTTPCSRRLRDRNASARQRGNLILLLTLAGWLLASCSRAPAPTFTPPPAATPKPAATALLTPVPVPTSALLSPTASRPSPQPPTPTLARVPFPTPVLATRPPENFVVAAAWGTPFPLAVERSAVLPGDLRLTFRRVTEDSRCPIDVNCAWSGQAIVVIHVAQGSRDHGEVSLTLVGSTSKPQPVPGGMIQPVKVEPPHITSVKLDPATYVVTLLLTR